MGRLLPNLLSLKYANWHRFGRLLPSLVGRDTNRQSSENIWHQRLKQRIESLRSCPYRIRLAKHTDRNPIMHFLDEHFVQQEPLIKSLQVHTAPGRNALQLYLEEYLHEGFTLLATADDGHLVGLSVGLRNCDWDAAKLKDQADRVQCERLRKLMYIWSMVSGEPNLHRRYSTHCIFEIAMLATAPEAQGRNVGGHLVLHSLQLARDLGFTVARMDCTNEFSSRLAARAGMDCLWAVPYEHLVDADLKPVAIPGNPHTHIKVHALQLHVP